ncbi:MULTISPECIES: hypothetical protein [unclassified Mesorhizobium]|uniref:hypothetical protein n=1 Tax=unclassified Mesorhizobium TaxID=325217 RepID=UPI000BB01562|nr:MULTISPECIES: hypothetical protein [unclassified Mesorhizobium]PBB83503.1 hypothetical protein CK216_28130 [Mesorhizobium sp. WSM3876]RWE19598.1 MAG: hypothetical protein EOS41_30155 [Mesorhizobium sp.]
MTARQLPALHDGHAPVMLHGAFDEALEAYQSWAPGTDMPQVEFECRTVPISSVFGRMRTCTDILPWRVQSNVSALMGGASIDNGEEPTPYADGAILLRSIWRSSR